MAKHISFSNLEAPCLSKFGEIDRDNAPNPELETLAMQGKISFRPGTIARKDSKGTTFLSPGFHYSSKMPLPIPNLYRAEKSGEPLFGGEYGEIYGDLETMLSQGILQISDKKHAPELFGIDYSILPVKAILEVTSACQCACSGLCYLGSKEGYTPPLGEILKRIDKLVLLGIPCIEISGGEATLRKDLKAILSHVQQSGAMSYLVSNGEFLADPAIFAEILPYIKKSGVVLSLDAIGEKHDMIRGRAGLFAKLETVFTWLEEENIPRMAINTVSSNNIDYLPDVIRYGLEHSLPVFVKPALNTGYHSSEINLSGRLNKVFMENPDLEKASMRKYITSGQAAFKEAFVYGCRAGQMELRVSPRGEVYFCPLDTKMPENSLLSYEALSLAEGIASYINDKLSRSLPCRDVCEISLPKQADPLNPDKGACCGPCQYSKIYQKGEWVIKNPDQIIGATRK